MESKCLNCFNFKTMIITPENINRVSSRFNHREGSKPLNENTPLKKRLDEYYEVKIYFCSNIRKIIVEERRAIKLKMECENRDE